MFVDYFLLDPLKLVSKSLRPVVLLSPFLVLLDSLTLPSPGRITLSSEKFEKGHPIVPQRNFQEKVLTIEPEPNEWEEKCHYPI